MRRNRFTKELDEGDFQILKNIKIHPVNETQRKAKKLFSFFLERKNKKMQVNLIEKKLKFKNTTGEFWYVVNSLNHVLYYKKINIRFVHTERYRRIESDKQYFKFLKTGS